MPLEQSLQGREHQLELMIQAIWGTQFRVCAIPETHHSTISYIHAQHIYLPAQVDASFAEASEFYLSSALHCAAHLIYSMPWSAENLNNRQKVLISVLEDARVEALSQRVFPALKKVFQRPFSKPKESSGFNGLVYELSYALRFTDFVSQNALVEKVQKAFLAFSEEELRTPDRVYHLGLSLANDVGQLRISMNERETFQLLPYLDDNAFLWEVSENVASEHNAAGDTQESVGVTGIAFEEAHAGKAVAFHVERSQEPADIAFTEAQSSDHQLFQQASTEQTLQYPEWDYRIGLLKDNWCSLVQDSIALAAENVSADAQFPHLGLVNRLQKIIQTFQFNRQKKRKQESGFELDLEALVEFRSDCVRGQPPMEAGIYIDHVHSAEQEIALLVLLDLSDSMNDELSGSDRTLLEVTEESLSVLSQLLSRLGHQYAIHGFNSEGRHKVGYQVFKAFGEQNTFMAQPFAKMKAQLSTRLGVALRHAYRHISQRKERHKLILVISDGQPSDIDVFDDRYLIEDAAFAVKEIENQGVKTFCLSLDQQADEYTSKIFKKGHYEVVEHPQKLAQTLTRLYVKLFKAFLK